MIKHEQGKKGKSRVASKLLALEWGKSCSEWRTQEQNVGARKTKCGHHGHQADED